MVSLTDHSTTYLTKNQLVVIVHMEEKENFRERERERERERIIFIMHLKQLQPKTVITDDLIW
jgi:hypothetical protein